MLKFKNVQNKEERLVRSEKFNTSIGDKSLLIAHKSNNTRMNALKVDNALWMVRDMKDPNNHKKIWCTRTELVILFNKLMDQGYSVSIC